MASILPFWLIPPSRGWCTVFSILQYLGGSERKLKTRPLICLLPTYKEPLPDLNDLKRNPLPFVISIKKNGTWPGTSLWDVNTYEWFELFLCTYHPQRPAINQSASIIYISSVYSVVLLTAADRQLNSEKTNSSVCFCFSHFLPLFSLH